MTKLRMGLMACLVIGTGLGSGVGPGSGAGAQTSAAKPAGESDAVVTMERVAALAAWARAARDPLALAVAAKLRLGIPTRELGGRLGAGDEAPPESIDPLDAETLFKEAMALAGNDRTIAALIQDARATGARGGVAGVIRGRFQVPAAQTHVFASVIYEGQKEAAVFIEGDGRSNLDLRVVDEFGNEVCHQTSSIDRELCRWTPRFRGAFRIEIVNTGGIPNDYAIVTN